MSEERMPVEKALQGYTEAVAAQDVEAFLGLYDERVHVFDSWGRWEYAGLDAWRGMVTEWFGSLGGGRVEVAFSEVSCVTGTGVAFGHAVATYSGYSAEGELLHAMTNRMSVGLEKTDTAWKIVHEHTSLPVDMASGAALFER
jgi:ketosteroid isomerase-like protein